MHTLEELGYSKQSITQAEIHEIELKEINRLINNNIDEFEEGIDILDLKYNGDYQAPLEELGFSNRDISISKNIYLLSEQGYMTLVNLMRTDKAKELRKKFRREYFAMRKVIKEQRPQCIEDLIIMQAQSMKEMRQQINQANNNALIANQIATDAQVKVQSIKDVVSLDTSRWRSDTQRMISPSKNGKVIK